MVEAVYNFCCKAFPAAAQRFKHVLPRFSLKSPKECYTIENDDPKTHLANKNYIKLIGMFFFVHRSACSSGTSQRRMGKLYSTSFLDEVLMEPQGVKGLE